MNKVINVLNQHFLAIILFLLVIKTIVVTFVGFNLQIESWIDILLILLSPLGISMLLIGLAFFFRKSFSPWTVFMIYILLVGLLYANLLYYRFYIDFVTVSVFLQLNNVGGLGPSTLELISPLDLFLFIDIVLLAFVLRKLTVTNMGRKMQYLGTSLALIALTFALALMKNPHVLQTNYDREQLVKSLGLYNYQIVNLVYGVQAPVMKVMASEHNVEPVVSYLEEKPAEQSNIFGLAKGKNLVLISLESTQNFVINREVNGQEITPFLNSLIEESYYFSNIYEQAAQGKTSDAEFMVHTGLYPLPSGSVFVRRPANEYISLPKILKESGNYTTATFHGNDITFWNRVEMYPSLGYDHLFTKDDYEITEANSVNYGIKDTPFFEQSIDHLKTLQAPYMASFLTLTNHFPFLLEEEDQRIAPAETSVEVFNRYVTTVNYQDAALQRFFQLMKQEGMYENTVFVLYGDHYGISQKYEDGVHELLGQNNTPLNHLKLQRIPLIIHIPGQTGQLISTLGGAIDIHATILELMGIAEESYLNFSENLLARDAEKPVVFRDGSMIAQDYAYLNNVCYKMNTEETVESERCEPYLQTVRTELQLSDEIILGDLLRFTE